MSVEFIAGFYPKNKHAKSPDFIKSVGSFNVDQALAFFTAKKEAGEEWVNYQVLTSKKDSNKLYAQVDNWERKEVPQQAEKAIKEEVESDGLDYPENDGTLIPF